MPHPHPWLVALPVRVVAAVLSRAFFQPDEYYQNLEPAYSIVFGPHAGAYSTWEWSLTPDTDPTWSHGGSGGIRSPLAVAASVAVYWVLNRARCDDGHWIVLAPRLAQACIAASMDVALVRLASRILGPAYTNAALFTTLTSFFHFFAASRTLTNSTETALTAWALRYWPFDADVDDSEASLACAMAVAALACVVRPSNAVVWAWLGGHLFVRSSARRRWELVRVTAVIGLLASLFSFALDTLFYSTPTFTPLRFLSTNVLRSISIFYGSNSPHFYLTQGLPILLLTQLPFFIDGLSSRRWQGVRNVRALEALRATLVGTLATYSLLSHKEWRFIHPLLPVMHLFVVLSLVSRFASSPSTSSTPPSSPTTRLARHLRVRASHATILLLSLLPATYLTHFHGSGQTRVSSYLRSLPLPLLEKTSVGWLMPCHSAAWGAHLHTREWGRELRELERDGKGNKGERGKGERGRMWMVTCEPPLEAQDSSTYQDETDLFYASPCEFLSTRFPSRVDPSFPSVTPSSDLEGAYTWPRRLVLFSSLLSQPCPHSSPVPSTVEGLLLEKGYEREWSAWNTLGGWHEDSRRRGRVEVWSWSAVGSGEGEEVRER